MPNVRFMTLDPGHFHAALVQKDMYRDVDKRVYVFASLGPDLVAHVNRIASFNARTESPTAWEMDVHASPDFFERMLRHAPGNVVVLSGRNRLKIDYIEGSVEAGLHVLADKPWILNAGDLPRLEAALVHAEAKGIVAYDIMTERFEVTNLLQRAFVNDRAAFGSVVPGTPTNPGVYMESVHYLKKTVAGAPNIRPTWFFDVAEQGEGLNDVGTHLVDLVPWTLFPDRPIDYGTDVNVIAAQRWPTWISEDEFRSVTNAQRFPDSLAAAIVDGRLGYYCNTLVTYAVRGVHTSLNVVWDWEAPPGAGDTHYASYRGTRSRIDIRQTREDRFRPELYVVPVAAEYKPRVLAAVQDRIVELQTPFPGVGVEDRGEELRITIPDRFRVGHEAHFAEVTASFLKYLQDPSAIPAWETPNMLAKYYVTTAGTELSRRGPAQPAPRIAPA